MPSGTVTPAGGGGGSLPAQWAVDAAGALTITLTGASGDNDFAPAFRIVNSNGTTIIQWDTSGDFYFTAPGSGVDGVNVTVAGASDHAVGAQGPGGQILDVRGDGGGSITQRGSTAFQLRDSSSNPSVEGFPTGKGVIVPPTADPHVVGAVWNNAGTLTISAG